MRRAESDVDVERVASPHEACQVMPLKWPGSGLKNPMLGFLPRRQPPQHFIGV